MHKLPSVLEVKACWDSMPSPSVRKVASALTASGKPISYATVQAMKTRGWVPAKPDLNGALSQLDAAVPLLTRNPTSKAEDLATDRPVTPAEVAQKALQVLDGILNEVKKQAPELIANSTGQTGNLIRSIASFQEAAFETHQQVLKEQPPPTGVKAKGDDPLAKAIEEWRVSRLPQEKPQ